MAETILPAGSIYWFPDDVPVPEIPQRPCDGGPIPPDCALARLEVYINRFGLFTPDLRAHGRYIILLEPTSVKL